jgi:hypothetical protein
MRIRLVAALIFLTGFSSCIPYNPLDVDVSAIEAEVKIERLDELLFTASPGDIDKIHHDLLKKHGELWEAYFSAMLKAGPAQDSLAPVYLDRFVNDETMKSLYKDIKKEFPDLDWLEKELEDAFRHLKYYYPDAKIPSIVTYNSVFNYGVATFEDQIGIGLDMYLGPENQFVKNISIQDIPQFVKDKMKKEYIVVDVMRGWFENVYMEPPSERDFLSRIVYEGKILYALDALLPNTPDHIKIRYTPDELGWCIENENNIWRDIIDKKMLYSTNEEDIMKFIIEGPFTSGMPQNSPARVGSWLGWRMVRAYMKENKDLKLPDLVKEQNARKILKSYKPQK